MSSSVKLMKLLNEVDPKRKYFHNSDMNQEVLCKVKSFEPLLILEYNNLYAEENEESRILNKVYEMLSGKLKQKSLTKQEIFYFMKVIVNTDKLKYSSELFEYLDGTGNLVHLELHEWLEFIENHIEKRSVFKLQENIFLMVVDDSLDEVPLVVDNDGIHVKTGDIVKVKMKKSMYLSNNGFVIPSKNGDFKLALDKIEIVSSQSSPIEGFI